MISSERCLCIDLFLSAVYPCGTSDSCSPNNLGRKAAAIRL